MNKKYYIYIMLLLVFAAIPFWKSCGNDDLSRDTNAEKTKTKSLRKTSEPKSRMEEIHDFFRNADTRMDFFGRVVDQDGLGVGNVTVHYTVGKAGDFLDSGLIKNTDEKRQVSSNADGKFEIKGAKGLTLSIGPLEKPGYRDGSTDPRAFGFKGTPELHHSDSQNPVEFVVVRSAVPKTRKVYQGRLRFAWNQGEVRTRLGAKLGDFVLTPTRVWRPDLLEDFDWNVKVSVERAELVTLGSYYAPIAPSEGYRREFEYGARKGDPKWRGGLQAVYAFKTTEGLYGLARLVIYPERADFEVNGSLDVRLNESGARNLD
jgi:hypothetical protein